MKIPQKIVIKIQKKANQPMSQTKGKKIRDSEREREREFACKDDILCTFASTRP